MTEQEQKLNDFIAELFATFSAGQATDSAAWMRLKTKLAALLDAWRGMDEAAH